MQGGVDVLTGAHTDSAFLRWAGRGRRTEGSRTAVDSIFTQHHRSELAAERMSLAQHHPAQTLDHAPTRVQEPGTILRRQRRWGYWNRERRCCPKPLNTEYKRRLRGGPHPESPCGGQGGLSTVSTYFTCHAIHDIMMTQ